MRILLTHNSTDDQMTLSQNLLVDFSNETNILYGKGFMTYNVHSIIHLTEDFRRFGPLDYVSCFPFESYLGILKVMFKVGTSHYSRLLSVSITIMQTLSRSQNLNLTLNVVSL